MLYADVCSRTLTYADVCADGISAPTRFVRGPIVWLRAGTRQLLLIAHESPAPAGFDAAIPRHLQVALQIVSAAPALGLGPVGTVVPVPPAWLRPVDRGGVYASVYPAAAAGGIAGARAHAALLLPAFSAPGRLLPLSAHVFHMSEAAGRKRERHLLLYTPLLTEP